MPTKRVLYIEDNPANFALVQRLLETTGRYSVHLAPDGPEGLTAMAANRPDLVLLDLDLPSMNGIDVLIRIKADASIADVPVLVVTASVMQRERTKALKHGAHGFIEKPFDITEFRDMVDQAAGHSPTSSAT